MPVFVFVIFPAGWFEQVSPSQVSSEPVDIVRIWLWFDGYCDENNGFT
jgi:hypothetical protein